MTLDEALTHLHELPAIPAVVQEVISSFSEPDVDIEKLARKIGQDQALTAKVLRVANSSFYGFPRKIAALQDAVVIMGLSGVRSLVLSAGLLQTLGKNDGGALNRQDYWKRSFRVASYAKAVARCLRQPAEIAFTAGLLHGIGELALDTCLPELYAQALAQAEAEACDLITAEQNTLGFHHDALGAEVARRWNFPSVIEQAIRNCHSANISTLEPLSTVVCMAVLLEQGTLPSDIVQWISEADQECTGSDASQLIALLPDAAQLEAGVASLLS